LRIYKSITPFSLKSTMSSELLRPDLFLFPNPAHDQLTINLISQQSAASEIIIYDLLNRVVYHSEINLSEGYQQFSVPVWSLEKGVYELVIQNDYKFWEKGFVKQ
jgi:Secretion system C-terminal sorting domain